MTFISEHFGVSIGGCVPLEEIPRRRRTGIRGCRAAPLSLSGPTADLLPTTHTQIPLAGAITTPDAAARYFVVDCLSWSQSGTYSWVKNRSMAARSCGTAGERPAGVHEGDSGRGG
jgi:hypothetical protein